MIKQIDIDNFDDITDIVDNYTASREDSPRPQVPFIEQIKGGLEKDRVEILANYDEKIGITGFAVLGLVSNRISVLYVDTTSIGEKETQQIEKDLFDEGVNRLKGRGTQVRVGLFAKSESLSEYILEKDFQKFDRARMTLDKEGVDKLESPILPEGYTFASYESGMRDEFVDLIFKSNEINIDIHVFPEFFANTDACFQLLKNIEESRYGKYKEPQSKIILKDGNYVGVCFMTLTAEDTGYIPEIAIIPAHRRLGLGRFILIHSMKELVSDDEKVVRINLDVTSANHAVRMYQSVGFKETGTYAMYSLQNE